MPKRLNNNLFASLRQKLRRETPPAERLLWSRLRRKQLNGYKFRRQYGIEEYVVDFYCSEACLVVEIDGPTHFNDVAEQQDPVRQQRIEKLGITVLRFTNDEVYRNMEGVLTKILERLDAPASSSGAS
ncbi:endonuclease domain-containing protein [Nitrospina watsonii]|uniref:Ribonuclease P n=1 Tax=Nitrospina watsonii TaxID=1323948 RepID=A0ABM9HI14_9BACT|nr:endonuclease domain-containing protein [Nitrospina watsonii]CAI2719701.1 putative Ribonuclease P [Nitrospina watsonii]